MSDELQIPGAEEQPTKSLTIDELGLSMGGSNEKISGPKAFLYAFFQLFKTAQYHAIDNSALVNPMKTFIKLCNSSLEQEGGVSLQAKDGNMFFNSNKLKMSTEEYELAETVFEFFEERAIGGFVVTGAIDDSSVQHLLEIMVYAAPEELTLGVIQKRFSECKLPFKVNKTLGVRGGAQDEVVLERRTYTFLTYSKLVVLYRSLIATDASNHSRRLFLVKKICRTIESLIDICIEDDHTFLGISSVKSGEAYAPHHAANTAVLSLSLGDKIGLDKVDMADLGVAAVFANIGQDQVPDPMLEKQAQLDAEERRTMERHTLDGVDYLLGERVLSKSVLRRIAVAFGHHLKVDGGGYPTTDLAPDLFSRIVAIADTYDALTTDRPWRKALLPDEALGELMKKAGDDFDPTLVKIFVNTLGLYPIGTLVRLNGGELAVVIYGGGEGERISRPIVATLGPDGRPAESIDLAAKGSDGSYLRDIVKTEDPSKYGLQPSGLLAEAPIV